MGLICNLCKRLYSVREAGVHIRKIPIIYCGFKRALCFFVFLTLLIQVEALVSMAIRLVY